MKKFVKSKAFGFTNFFTLAIFEQGCTFFYSQAVFKIDIISFCKLYNLSCFSLLQEEESVQADVEIATTFIARVAFKYCHTFFL